MPGDVIRALLPQRIPPGREQEGIRPCVVVANPRRTAQPRFPVLVVVPLTTAGGPWVTAGGPLYPTLPSGAGGLPAESVALLDHLGAIDARRVISHLGRLDESEYRPLSDGLARLMELSAVPGPS